MVGQFRLPSTTTPACFMTFMNSCATMPCPMAVGWYPVEAEQTTLTEPLAPVRVVVLRIHPRVDEIEVVGKVVLDLPGVALEGEAFEDPAGVHEVVTLFGMFPVLLVEQPAYVAVVGPYAVVYVEGLRQREVDDVPLAHVVLLEREVSVVLEVHGYLAVALYLHRRTHAFRQRRDRHQGDVADEDLPVFVAIVAAHGSIHPLQKLPIRGLEVSRVPQIP